MRITICGAGRVGQGIARRLSNERHEVTLVDSDAALIRAVTTDLDVRGVVGHAAFPDTLRRAGLEDADMLIAVTYSDEVNIVACQVANALFRTPTKIARIRSQEYLSEAGRGLFGKDTLPIDVVISPEVEVAESVLQRLELPGAFLTAKFASGAARLVGVRLDDDSPLINTDVHAIPDIFPGLTSRLVGLGRNTRLFAPQDGDAPQAGDRAYFITKTEEIERMLDIIGKPDAATRSIVIVGAGNIGLYVARRLEQRGGVKVRVIEADRQHAERAAAALRRSIVIHGDGLNVDILSEAGVAGASAVVGLTNDDRTNLLLASVAKQAGAKRVMSLVNNPELSGLREAMGVDVVIDPRGLTISRILIHLRRGRILELHSLEDGAGEIIEGVALKTSELVGSEIGEDLLPEGLNLGAIYRDNAFLDLSRPDRVRVGDRLIVFSERESNRRLEHLFRVSAEFVG